MTTFSFPCGRNVAVTPRPSSAAILRDHGPVFPQRSSIQRPQLCATATLRDHDPRCPASIPRPLLSPSRIFTSIGIIVFCYFMCKRSWQKATSVGARSITFLLNSPSANQYPKVIKTEKMTTRTKQELALLVPALAIAARRRSRQVSINRLTHRQSTPTDCTQDQMTSCFCSGNGSPEATSQKRCRSSPSRPERKQEGVLVRTEARKTQVERGNVL